MKGSTGWISGRRQDDIHTSGRIALQKGQKDGFQEGDETMLKSEI